MLKKLFVIHTFVSIIGLFSNSALADIEKNIINTLTSTQTLSFNFTQIIDQKKEVGNCLIKYPLLMKCSYQNYKKKIIISNGKTLAIIKKKYKKIYLYPLKSTPLFTILQKKKIYQIVRNSNYKKKEDFIEYEIFDIKKNKLKIFFDKKVFTLKGWETEDIYSNKVNFLIEDLKINKIVDDNTFKIPKEEDL